MSFFNFELSKLCAYLRCFLSIYGVMSKLVLLIGGNMGNREAVFNSTIKEIASNVGTVEKTSPLYESEAWGFESNNLFLNQVLVVSTSKRPHECLRITQSIEKKLGRVRHTERYCSRTIDIDILFYNSEVIDTENLTVPHPRIQERNFALAPLKDVMEDYTHPVLNKKISTLLEECTDKGKVYKL